MNDKKGFTLIELLAVIVILAVIALIATPIIMNVINDAKKGAAKDTAYGIIGAAELEMSKSGFKTPVIYTESSDLNTKGTKAEKMILEIDKDGNIRLDAFIDGYCVVKDLNKDEVRIDEDKKTAEVCVQQSTVSFARYISDKSIAGNNEGLIIDDTEQKNIRYAGLNVNNYVLFNNEMWRIIGVFDGKVKIVRDQTLNTAIYKTATNNWPDMDIAKYLNNEYLDILTSDAQKMISDTKYYLGGTGESDLSRFEMYQKERGTEVSSCDIGTEGCPRATEWTGKIALMYPSDYGYAAGKACPDNTELVSYDIPECRDNNWLNYDGINEWFITPSSLNELYGYYYTFYKYDDGGVSRRGYNSSLLTEYRPTLYLKTDVSYVRGNGTKNDPYIIQ